MTGNPGNTTERVFDPVDSSEALRPPPFPRVTARSVKAAFDLSGRVAVITGGAGLLGVKHAEAIAELGGHPVLLDLDAEKARQRAEETAAAFNADTFGLAADVTDRDSLLEALAATRKRFGQVDILINNAACDPKVGANGLTNGASGRLENFPAEVWHRHLEVSLTGAFFASQVFGAEMARRGHGVILNIASDMGILGPDQRIYRQAGLDEHEQPVKPVSYCVAKAGLLGLTRYLATYWAERGVRVNAISPGGVFQGQDPAFIRRLSGLIPLGRMAGQDEYKAAIVFLVSDASSYMTGANLVIDGGRSCW